MAAEEAVLAEEEKQAAMAALEEDLVAPGRAREVMVMELEAKVEVGTAVVGQGGEVMAEAEEDCEMVVREVVMGDKVVPEPAHKVGLRAEDSLETEEAAWGVGGLEVVGMVAVGSGAVEKVSRALPGLVMLAVTTAFEMGSEEVHEGMA